MKRHSFVCQILPKRGAKLRLFFSCCFLFCFYYWKSAFKSIFSHLIFLKCDFYSLLVVLSWVFRIFVQQMKPMYQLLSLLLYMLSLLPMRVLYLLSHLLFYPFYHLLRYRRRVVRENLSMAFPSMNKKSRKKIELTFYHHFCDYFFWDGEINDHLSQKYHEKG